MQLHATWSKEQWIAHIKEAAAKERSHISQVIHVKKQRDDEYIAELESMISRKEVRAVGGAAVAVVHRPPFCAFAGAAACAGRGGGARAENGAAAKASDKVDPCA